MNKIIIILLLFPLFAFAQFEEHNLVLKDSLALKNYNQGYIDSQEYFIATNDYLVGLISGPVYYIPAILSYVVPPKRRRLENNYNPALLALYFLQIIQWPLLLYAYHMLAH